MRSLILNVSILKSIETSLGFKNLAFEPQCFPESVLINPYLQKEEEFLEACEPLQVSKVSKD